MPIFNKQELAIIRDALKVRLASKEGAMLEKQKELKHLNHEDLSLQSQVYDNEQARKNATIELESLEESHGNLSDLLEKIEGDAPNTAVRPRIPAAESTPQA